MRLGARIFYWLPKPVKRLLVGLGNVYRWTDHNRERVGTAIGMYGLWLSYSLAITCAIGWFRPYEWRWECLILVLGALGGGILQQLTIWLSSEVSWSKIARYVSVCLAVLSTMTLAQRAAWKDYVAWQWGDSEHARIQHEMYEYGNAEKAVQRLAVHQEGWVNPDGKKIIEDEYGQIYISTSTIVENFESWKPTLRIRRYKSGFRYRYYPENEEKLRPRKVYSSEISLEYYYPIAPE